MDEILGIAVKLLAALLSIAATWLGKKLYALIKAKLGENRTQTLNRLIAEFVAAAEQQFKTKDPDGSIRLNYVKTLLVQLGYEITDVVRAKIEAAVFGINMADKGAVAAAPRAAE